MGKKTTISLLKSTLFFLTILFVGISAIAQTSGPFIPYVVAYPDPAKGDPPIIRGDMVIISNSILGVDEGGVGPNDEFNLDVSSSGQTRAYIDIDSDPNRDTRYTDGGVPIFQNLLATESEYAGIPGTLSPDGSTLSNGQPILDDFDAPNYGQWVDGTPSLPGPFLPGVEEGTFSSSSADLKINSSTESCSTIQRAYLYWGGLYTGEQFIRGNNFRTVTRNRPDCIDENGQPCELYTDIKILPPRASEYLDIKFNNSGADANSLKTEIVYDDTWSRDLARAHSVYNKSSTVHPTAGFNSIPQNQGWQGHPSYACRADITSLMHSIEDAGESVEGFWTVANIRTTVGRKAWGLAAGWSIVVVYEDPLAPQKYISLFDGYVNVNSGTIPTTISGFETVPFGPVNVEFASFSLEGDAQLLGDNFRMNGTNIAATQPAGVASDIGYDSTNYFDSSILSIDRSPDNLVNLRRFPNSLVNLGFDADHFLLDNSGNSIIGNGDTSADVILTAPGNDQTATYFTGFSVEVIAPDLQVTKRVFRQDGTEIDLANFIVDLGDTIEYRIVIENVGNEEAVFTEFLDLIPINTNLGTTGQLRDTFEFNGIPIDESDPNLSFTTADSGEIDSNGDPILTTLVSYLIQDSVDASGNPDGNNGLLEPNESVTVTFSVQVVADCSLLRNACSGFIENQADVTYSAIINGEDFEIQSAFDVDACDTPDPAPTPFLADQAQCNVAANVPACQSSVLLQAGLGFDEYIWTLNGNPFPIDAQGNPTLNQDEIVVDQTGTYVVNEIVTLMNNCQDIFLSFDVLTLDPTDPSLNPFENVDEDFINENVGICPDTGVNEIVEIFLCDGAQTLGSDYPAGTIVSWQRLNTSAGCTPRADSTNCPFPLSDGAGGTCYDEFATTNTVIFDEAGDYRLTLTLTGGCTLDFFFRTIEFPANPDLQLTSGGGCAGPAELELVGLPSDYMITFRENDADGAILQGPSMNATYTVADPGDGSNVIIYAEGVPNVPEFVGCAFSDDLVVEFSTLSLTTLNVDQPVCFTDQDTANGRDDSKGQIFVQVGGAINYTYELEDRTTNTVIDSQSATVSNNHNFNNVDPGDYTVRVFSANYPISGISPTPAGCFLEEDITIEEFFPFDVAIDIVQLTCQPAQVNFDLDSSEPTPDYSQFTTRLIFNEGTPDEIIESFSGEIGSILLADTLNTPSEGPDDGGIEAPDDGFEDLEADVYIEDLLINGTTARLEVFRTTGGGSCSIERSVIINPFTPLTLTAAAIAPIACTGEGTEVSITAAGDNLPDITGYEITSAPATFTGTTTSPTGVFTDLIAGDYTFVATQDIDGVMCTAEVLFTLVEPDPIDTPIIAEVQPYTCDATGSIDLTNAATITGGTTPYTYRLLKYADAALTTLVDTRQITDINDLPYESLTDGFYVLEIEDDNFCTSVVSNTIAFAPLSDVTLTLDASPILTCDSLTTPVQVSATATNSGVIEGYSIIFSSNPTIIADDMDFSNTTGQFDLPVGDYEIVARTTNTLCVSDPLIFTVDPLVNISAIQTGGRGTLTCIGDNNGSANYSVSGFGATTGYSYTITQNTVAYTPAASNPQPGTNLTANTLLLESLEMGVYEITFTDDFTNCTQVVNFSISDPTLAVVSLLTAPQYNCSPTGIGDYTFTVTATGGETGYTFTDGTTSNSDGVFTIPATTLGETIMIGVDDGNGCPGAPFPVIIQATPDFQLTNATIEQCLTDGDDITVPFTGGVAPIQYRLDGAATFTEATISGTDFIIDTNITVAGSYTYLIVDANNNESCARELEVIFYDDIDISNLSTTTVDCNATSGAVPNTGTSITFEVDGGVGAYTYTFETAGITTTALNPDTGSTDANPTFTFDDSFDEEEITITIANASGCGVPATVSYTPDYPEVPTIDQVGVEEMDGSGGFVYNTPTFICDGETIEITVIPDFEAGEDINSFTYIFDRGAEQLSNSMQYTEGTTSFMYQIKRISTGCLSAEESGTLNLVDPIAVGPIVTTDEICNTAIPAIPTDPIIPLPPTKGTATIPILNGTGPYTVTVTNLDDPSLPPIIQNTTTNSIFFDPLEIGDHSVEITDANGCVLPGFELFRIIPEPNVQFRNQTIVADCVNRVTYFFEIEDGRGPFEIGLSIDSFIDPVLFGDDISNFNDPEFNSTLFATVDAGPFVADTPGMPGSGNENGVVDYDRVYSITRLEFDQPYTVFVRDTATGCFSSADVDAQPSESLVINSIDTVNTGACALNSGEVSFEYEIIDGSTFNYIAEIIDVFGNVDTSITPITIDFDPLIDPTYTGTLTGLPEGNHILRIRPEDTTNECSGTANFAIGTEPPLGDLEIAFERGSSCAEAAQLELRVAGGGGRMPYEYLLLPVGQTPDDSTIFTEAAVISETTILSFTEPDGTVLADAFVRDASGCISEVENINIPPLIEPTLTLELSLEDCEDDAPFTTDYTIGNFDASKTYTFTVNGDTPGNAQITITDPGTTGTGTVSAENRDTYSIEVIASDNPSCPGTAIFELAEDVINIMATLDEPDCDDNLDFITVDVVDGGFVGIPTRGLEYRVFSGTDITGTLIATVIPSPIATSFTFNAGTDYGSGVLALVAGQEYSVQVIDYYDIADTAGRQCFDVHEGLIIEPVILPTFVTPVPEPLTCSTANDGQIELTLTGPASSIEYRLFEFPTAADAQAVITANDVDTVILSGTEIASNSLFTEGNIFTGLQGESNAAYVAVAFATSLSCPLIYNLPIIIDEPEDTLASSFVLGAVTGNCDNTDLVPDVLPQVTIEVVGTLPSALTDYEIEITPSVGTLTNPFTFADLTLVSGTTYAIDANSLPSQAYTISIRDVTTTCPPLEYVQLVLCETELDQVGVAVTSPAIPCFDVTATSAVTFGVTPANGNPLLFDYTLTTTDDTAIIIQSGTDETTSPITITGGLLAEEYVLVVTDKNVLRIPPVVTSFEVTMPADLPDFSLAQERTDCNSVEITATPVNGTGTPNTSDPAYTFEISADGSTFNPMTSTVTGAGTSTITPPATGIDTYTVRITDFNNCQDIRTIDIEPQEQLTVTAVENLECLNLGDASATITITTGTSPFTVQRTNTGTGNVISTDITNTSFPIEVDDTITTSGTYEYVITDAFGCTSAALPITIEDALTLTVVPVPASTVCDMNNDPESSRYELMPTGGDGTYTYEVAIGDVAISTNNFVAFTPVAPNTSFVVDPDLHDGERFVFRVSDGLGCPVIFEPALVTFPTFPQVTFANIVDIECPGANGSADLTVTPGNGQPPYEIFVTETGTAFPTTPLAGDPLAGITFTTAIEGTFDFKVVDDNGCESGVGQFAISNSVIILKNFAIEDITCTDTMVVDDSGSITLSVSNAEHPITFSFSKVGDTSFDQTVVENNIAIDEASFNMLTAGDYEIEVTDANNCDTPFVFEATVNTNTDIVIGDFQVIDENCIPGATGITIAFPVDGIGMIQIEDPLNGGGVVDPTNTGDNIFKFDDAADPFPNTMPPVTLGADDRFFVASNLAADTEYTIVAQDGSGCQTQRVFRTPANDNIQNITAEVTSESFCKAVDGVDGTIAVDFELNTAPVGTLFDIYLFEEDGVTLASILPNPEPGVAANPGGPKHTFTGLRELDYVVIITEAGESPLCGNSIEVEVDKAPSLILDTPSFGEANCQNNFIVPVTASAQFGIAPYEYAIVMGSFPAGSLPPIGTVFSPSNMLTADTNMGADLNWSVFVRDASGCEEDQPIIIDSIENPDFVIDPQFSVDQCETAVASFEVTGQILNYDPALEPYTFTLNGSDITPSSTVAGTFIFEVPNRGLHTIEAFDRNGCDDNDDDEITIFEQLEILISLGDVTCDGDVSEINYTVMGGSGGTYTYQVFDVNDLTADLVDLSGTITATTIPVTGLLPETDYVVTVTDMFSATNSCIVTSNTDRFEEIQKSSINAIPQPVSCNGDTDGIITIEDITVGEIPITYALYSYTNLLVATNAANSNMSLTGTDVTSVSVNATNERLFEGLAIGNYVAFVRNGSIPCYTASEVITITEPPVFDSGFVATSIDASCVPQVSPGILISVNASLNGEAPYFYRIPGVIENFVEITNAIPGSSFEVNALFNAGEDYDIIFTDASGVSCGTITNTVMIPEFNGSPNLDLISQDQVYDCFNNEAITIGITNRDPLGTETYTFTNTIATDLDGNPITPVVTPSTTDITSQVMDLGPGRYTFEATSSLGCVSNEFEYIVRELEPLRVEATGNIVACFGDLSTIEFEVIDYIGDYTYTVSYVDASNVTQTTTAVAANTSTGVETVTNLDVNTYTINVVAGTPAPGVFSTNSLCQSNTAIAQIIGPDSAVSILPPQVLTQITCIDLFAEVLIEADGGFGNYQYRIQNSAGTIDVTNTTGFFDTSYGLVADFNDYTATVTDLDNPLCDAAQENFPITAPIQPVLDESLNSYSIACFGGNIDVRVQLDPDPLVPAPTANTADLRYSLFIFDVAAVDNRGAARVVNQAPNNPLEDFVIFADIEAGEYLAEVSDIFGCVYDYFPITVSEPALLALNANVTREFTCTGNNENNEVWTATALGGTPPYTYSILTETDLQLNGVSTANAAHLGGGVFNVSPFRIVTVQVVDDMGCTTTTVIETGKGIDPIEFEVDYIDNKLCFGEADGFVRILNDLVTGGEGNYVYTLFEAGSVMPIATDPVDNFFGDLPAGDYVYEVSSNDCMAVTRNFTIEEEPEIVAEINVIPVSCRGANDAQVSIMVTEDPGNPFDLPTSFTYTLSANDGSTSSSFTRTDLSDPVVFPDLVAGIIGGYTWTVINNNSIGCLETGVVMIDDKTDIIVDNGIFDNINIIEIGGLCDGDVNGEIQMYVSGGERTPATLANPNGSYYYEVRTDFSTNPDLGAIKAAGNELVYVSTDANGDLFTVFEVFDTDTPYEIIIVDEGNGLIGDDFNACVNIQEFEFETEDLDNFTPNAVPNCDTLGYTISAANFSEIEDPELLRIYVYEAGTFGADPPINPVAIGGSNLADVEVIPGSYEVVIVNEVTNCSSITAIPLGLLDIFDPVQFVELNAAGEAIQPFAATSQVNVYVLQVQGGVDPTSAEPYIFEATYTDLNGNVQTIEVENDGTFEVPGPGAYMFTVFDNVAENGQGCSDTVGPIGLNRIDIDIPNVFNPTSSDPLTNTWFPDNLTADFTKDGVNNPLISVDPNTPQIPVLIENTGGVVTGGTTVGGTTTGGYVTGGDIISNTSTVPIDNIPSGTASTTFTNIGGTTIGGETTGGYIIVTTTDTSGMVTVEVYTGGILQGGTMTTGGIVTGGTFVNISSGTGTEPAANILETVVGEVDPGTGETTYTITVGGETTGGTTTGGTTSGGVTIGDVTNGGATTGATTVDGTNTGGTTIVITQDTTDNTTIEAFTNTTVDGGTTRNGTTTGGTTAGGSLSGGISTTVGVEFVDYENIEVLVFDRYGRLLAEFQGIEEKGNGGEGWDGTYQGKLMPSGDYWYLIKLNDIEGREFTGHFTLYRRN